MDSEEEVNLRSRNSSVSYLDVKVYPTPILEGDNLKIETTTNIELLEIQLFDINGSLVRSYKQFNDSGLNEINLSEAIQGMYLLKLYTREGQEIVKKIFIK